MDIMTSAACATGLMMLAMDYTGPLDGQDNMQDEMKKRMYGVLPTQHKESAELSALKEKFPKFKDCRDTLLYGNLVKIEMKAHWILDAAIGARVMLAGVREITISNERPLPYRFKC